MNSVKLDLGFDKLSGNIGLHSFQKSANYENAISRQARLLMKNLVSRVYFIFYFDMHSIA